MMENGKLKIFMVVQNTDNLYGYVFSRAVVVAENEEEALRRVEEELSYSETEDETYFDRGRTVVIELGEIKPEKWREIENLRVGVNQTLSQLLVYNCGCDIP